MRAAVGGPVFITHPGCFAFEWPDGRPCSIGISSPSRGSWFELLIFLDCLRMLDSMQRILFFCTVDTVIGTLKGV